MVPCTRLLTGQRFLPFKDIATVTGVCTYSTIDVFPWCTRAGRTTSIMRSTCYWTSYNCNILSGLEHSSLSSSCQQPQSLFYHYTFIGGKDQLTHKLQKVCFGYHQGTNVSRVSAVLILSGRSPQSSQGSH